jgi:hypothetical protein
MGVGDPKERLAEHLMTFYWHGKLPYRGTSGILGKFFLIATDKLRGHALEFLRRSIHSSGKVSPAVIERLRKLWEGRAEKAKGDPVENVRTLAGYGWWFASGKVPQIFDGGPCILAVFRAALAALRSARPTPCTNRVFSVCRLFFKDSLQQLRGKSGQSSTDTLSLLQAAGNPLRW